jgi:hypothetical protein
VRERERPKYPHKTTDKYIVVHTLISRFFLDRRRNGSKLNGIKHSQKFNLLIFFLGGGGIILICRRSYLYEQLNTSIPVYLNSVCLKSNVIFFSVTFDYCHVYYFLRRFKLAYEGNGSWARR